MSFLALVPLIATLVICIGAALFAMKKKALAQAYCVQESVRMQDRLKDSLKRLLKLNRQSENLRHRRLTADRALTRAIASGNPYAIAAAKAVQTAVILQQTAHRARQEAILTEAARERQQAVRALTERVRELRAGALDSRAYYGRALAVEPRPASSLTPNFEPVPGFSRLQQHRFRFQVNLAPPFSLLGAVPGLRQLTECAVSLTGKDQSWQVRILAANPASSS